MQKLVCYEHGRIQAQYAEDDDSAPGVPGRCHDQSLKGVKTRIRR
jgi:hypothetical protein